MIRYPRIFGGVWIALGLLFVAVALAGAFESIRQRGNWSMARDGAPVLFILSWATAAMVGGVLLLSRRPSGQVWIGATSATAVVLIATRLLGDPSAVYFQPLWTSILTLALALFFYCLTGVLLSGWRKYRRQSAATRPGVEWTIVLLSLMVFLGVLFTPTLEVFAQQTSLARWWRCRETPRPLLAKTDAWTLTYSWADGYGPGLFRATVGFDGHTRLEAQRVGASVPVVRDVLLPMSVIARLSHAIDDTGLLCERPTLRAHRVFDLGRFAVRVHQGTYDKEIYADECHKIEGTGLAAVANILRAQQPLLGPEISWGPYASTTGGPCPNPRKPDMQPSR